MTPVHKSNCGVQEGGSRIRIGRVQWPEERNSEQWIILRVKEVEVCNGRQEMERSSPLVNWNSWWHRISTTITTTTTSTNVHYTLSQFQCEGYGSNINLKLCWCRRHFHPSYTQCHPHPPVVWNLHKILGFLNPFEGFMVGGVAIDEGNIGVSYYFWFLNKFNFHLNYCGWKGWERMTMGWGRTMRQWKWCLFLPQNSIKFTSRESKKSVTKL